MCHLWHLYATTKWHEVDFGGRASQQTFRQAVIGVKRHVEIARWRDIPGQ
jgi:hypothetical protein